MADVRVGGLDAQSLRDMRERADVWLEAGGVAHRSYTAEMARDVVALVEEVERLVGCVAEAERLLQEKKQELAVAYGSGRSDDEREWFSALDRLKAERDELQARVAEAEDRAAEAWRTESERDTALRRTLIELHRERAALADARDALERIAEERPALKVGPLGKLYVEQKREIAREVLVRLNQESDA